MPTTEHAAATSITEHLVDLIAKLRQRASELPDPRDLTYRQQEARASQAHILHRTIHGLRNRDDEKPRRILSELLVRREQITAKQQELTAALSTAPDVTKIEDATDRQREQVRQHHMAKQLQLLERGELLYAPGLPYERLVDIDAQIAKMRQRLADAEQQHNEHLNTAKQLLDLDRKEGTRG
jgi:hypothetical protein